MRTVIPLLILFTSMILSCSPVQDNQTKIGFEVLPSTETEPVKSRGDAADDPAIWLHPSRPEKSFVFGTDKNSGILAYDLSGRQKAFYPVGEINNIDVAYGVSLDQEKVDVLCATNRTLNTLEVYKIHPRSGLLKSLPLKPFFHLQGLFMGFVLM